ncbi:prephenate dehydrogenase [Georgenia sp. Z1491]|uniref:prephenate dehydrogenase n=1 Tax=Georgenia sp. Z1491 TaxID=3416707 RepID=UPI003CFAB958
MTDDLPRRAAATAGPVRIVGTGLLGASLGLALRSLGVEVRLADTSPVSLALARDLGAGDIAAGSSAVGGGPPTDEPGSREPATPAIVVVATPPDVAAEVVLRELAHHPGAVVTDVASVKDVVARDILLGAGEAAPRYVGSHPMAGRERSGATGADADLFAGRPWVVVPTERSSADAVRTVRALAQDVGSFAVDMAAAEHDRAVAVVSHLPQVLSSLLAARLNHADEAALGLAGQGLRDTTRIAAADPRLWSAILTGNAAALAAELRSVRDSLDEVLGALDLGVADPLAAGAVRPLADAIRGGNEGAARIPGKHGGAPRRYAEVTVLVPDAPGQLGRLFSEVGDAGVSIEDLGIEHSAGQRVGLVRLSVVPSAAADLEIELDRRGWRVVAS